MAENYYRVEDKFYEADDLLGTSTESQVLTDHRQRIEPWLSAIFQSEHLNLLIGSGFSLGLSAKAGVDAVSMSKVSIEPSMDEKIKSAASRSAKEMGRGEANIEDQLRAALALYHGLQVLDDKRYKSLGLGIDTALMQLASDILKMETNLLKAQRLDNEKGNGFVDALSGFLLSFAGRTASRDRLHVFTTNYDRVLEHGFDLIGIRPIDRFVGGLSPHYRSSRFDVDIHYAPAGGRTDARPLEGVVRYTKLHGSIDWVSEPNAIVRHALPFGGTIPEVRDGQDLMIFPNSAKDIETAFYPYADLFRDFSSALCRPNSALVTYGYGFGDEHINRVLRDMLTLPSTHLVIVSFDDKDGRISKFVDSLGRKSQVTLIIGSALAEISNFVSYYLPKTAVDTIALRQQTVLAGRVRPGKEASTNTEVPNDA